MSKKSSYGQSGHAEQADYPFMAPSLAFEPGLAGSAEWGSKVQEGMAMLNSEWLNFVTRRLGEDLSLTQRLVTSKSPADIWTAYSEFWTKASDDYAKEFATMIKLASGSMSSTIVAMQSRFDEAATKVYPLPEAA